MLGQRKRFSLSRPLFSCQSPWWWCQPSWWCWPHWGCRPPRVPSPQLSMLEGPVDTADFFTVSLQAASTPGYIETWLYHNHIPLCCDITLNVFSSIFMTNTLVSLLFFNVMLKEKTVLALLEKWYGSFEEGIYVWKRQKRKCLLTVLSHFSNVSLNRSYKLRWNNNQTNLKHHCPLWLASYVMQDIGLPFEGRQTSNLISRESWLKIYDVKVGPTEARWIRSDFWICVCPDEKCRRILGGWI